ncbi:PHB depolymerase family esterase [Glaciimonas immobilis]|nr:PHB depolymerase family esterase [Glaciimonas immobilis]
MQYWLYLPSVAASSPSPLPLVVMLHGCNQNVDDFVRGTRMNQLAETKGFAVLYPQQSASAHLKRCWNWYNRDTQAGGGDARRIAAIINVVSDAYPIDKTRVYIAGLSAGATMASIVALNYPHLITAVGIHSGTVFGAGHSIIGAYGVMQRGSIKNFPAAINAIVQKYPLFPTMPAMLIHGLSDTVVRPVNAKQLTQQFIALNKVTDASQVAVTTKSASAANSSNPQNSYRMEEYYAGGKLVIKVCEITALGHAWSGGDGTVNYNACEGPDATHMLWEFFKRQQRIAVP